MTNIPGGRPPPARASTLALVRALSIEEFSTRIDLVDDGGVVQSVTLPRARVVGPPTGDQFVACLRFPARVRLTLEVVDNVLERSGWAFDAPARAGVTWGSCHFVDGHFPIRHCAVLGTGDLLHLRVSDAARDQDHEVFVNAATVLRFVEHAPDEFDEREREVAEARASRRGEVVA